MRLAALAEEPILLLKKPSWIGERGYPTIPKVSSPKAIVLVRHPYTTYRSIAKMQAKVAESKQKDWTLEEVLDYWIMTYRNLRTLSVPYIRVRYQDLVSDPVEETDKIFKFMGLDHRSGTDQYEAPRDYDWAWYNDDGGEKIKTLQVQSTPVSIEPSLMQRILSYPGMTELMIEYGFSTNLNPDDIA